DLCAIREIGPQKLRAVLDTFSAMNPPPLRPETLVAEAARVLGGDSDIAESLIRQAVSISGLVRAARLERGEAADGIRKAVQRDGRWNAQELEQWQTAEDTFFDIAYSRPVRLVAKAIDLSYEYANLYRRARIVTDVRPLYTEDAGAIEGAVVSFSLGLRFQS